MLPEPRLKRFLTGVIPWRLLFTIVLAVATVPALAVGLAAEAYALAVGEIPAMYPRPAEALLLVAGPLAALLLATSGLHIRSRSRQVRALRREAERTNDRLAAIIGATEDAIVLLDLKGIVRGWNPAAERLYALPAADALGRPFDSLIDDRDVSAARDAFMVVVAADRRVTTEGRHRRGDGTFPTSTTWSAVRHADGTVDGVAILVRDPSAGSDAAARLDAVERRARLLTDTAADGVLTMDAAGRIVGWNPAATRLFGLTEDQVQGMTLGDVLVAPDDAPDGPRPADGDPDRYLAWLARAGTTTRAAARRADGSTFPIELSLASYEDDGATFHTAFVRDISARLAAELLAQEHEARYQSLVEHLPGVVYRCKVGRWAPTTYISPHLATMLGYQPEEWLGVPGIWEEHIHPQDLQRVLAEDEAEAAGPAEAGMRNEDREYRMRTRDGREIWVRDHADLERDADGVAVAWNGFLTDITERKHLESELLRLAFHDPLTGLANRALLNDRATHAIARHVRDRGMLGMLVIDVDDFKRVNDAHGHDAGDRLLVAVAERLRACVRADATIARLGGDEFAVLLEGLTDDAAALVVAQRVVRAFDRPLRIEGATLTARVSVGVAVDVTGQRDAAWLMRSADTAMYEAKRLGKGRWQAYDPAAHLASAKRLVLENELRRAVDRGQFALVYQPITDLQSGAIVGTEALIRWNHPTRGLVGPVEFISVLESTGLIEPVGRWVVNEACRQAAAWADQLPSLQWTSVNVSPAQLRSDDFYACVQAAIAGHGLDPSRLTLEVTESLALDDSIVTVERLHALRSLGVLIAVDDFGTGYSSLGYLRRLPIDKLKIDRAFVDGLGTDPESAAVAKAIVELAHGLHLTTVAEGIEHAHQAEALRALGCELGQGYLFAKPLQAPDLAALVVGRQAASVARRAAAVARIAV